MIFLSFILLLLSIISVEPCSNSFVPEYPSFVCAPEFGSSYVHVASNGFYTIFGIPWSFDYYFFFILAIFFVGVYLNRWSADKAFLFLSSFLLTFGADALLLHAVAAFPFLYRFKGNFLSTLFYGLISGPLSILSGFVSLRTILIPILILIFYPTPIFPNYPDNARVLNDIYPEVAAWIGATPRPIVIDREILSRLFLLPSLALLVFGFSDKLIKICCLILLLDYFSYPPGIGTELSPITVISRVIPGWSYIPVHFVVFGIGLASLFRSSIWKIRAYSVLVLMWSLYLGHPIFVKEPKLSASEPTEALSLALRSPSSRLIRTNQEILNTVKLGGLENFKTERSIKKFSSRITASTGDIKEIGSTDGRWTSGPQKGGEWVAVQFNFEQKIRGMKLKTGHFHTDYPRLLEFSWSLNCPEKFTEEGLENKIKIYPERVIFYADTIYPYLATPSDTKIILDDVVTVRCVMFKQIGETSKFDWSINDIMVLR